MTDFVHLHVHSHYSLLDSTVGLKALVAQTKALGMDAVALTDHGNMHGAIELQKVANSAGIKPIFGAAVNVVDERNPQGRAVKSYQLVLVARDLEGYHNLVRLVSMGWVRRADLDAAPTVTWVEVADNAPGLICLTGDIGGEIPHALLLNDTERATATLHRLWGIFGRENVYIELQRPDGLPEFHDASMLLIEFAAEHDAPLVATNNVHYLKAEDYAAHAILMCIGLKKRITREVIERIPLRSLHLRSPEEMAKVFEDVPEALRNTRVIADRCEVTIPTGTPLLPDFPVPEGFDPDGYLWDRASAGLDERFAEFTAQGLSFEETVYRERLQTEAAIIAEMGFAGYFLIVWDFIRWAREHDIPVGPGRGSGAGSLIAYSLRITDIDPIRYGLLFERFLNPQRVSMPDFDIDFCPERRAEVIRYVAQAYGEDHVGQIVTFGQLKARASIRDAARVVNLPYSEADQLAKLVPDELGVTLEQAFEREPQLRQLIADSEAHAFLWEGARALEGTNRNTGIHAAGIVIAKQELWETVPVMVGSKGEYVTQYAKDEVEAAGLVKFDFLGLKTLTLLNNALQLVNRIRPADDPLSLAEIPLDSAEVYAMIGSGDTVGVFQMESSGFQSMARQLKPDCFEDIIAAVALYRPGPLDAGVVSSFINRKHGREQVEYPHPWLEPILRETYGVMVYQEQVMEVARVLAGYSLGGADLLRRAMGKKQPEEMAKQRAIFVEGASAKGVPADKAGEIFDLVNYFAGYGFNKSHSAAYALVTYHTAWFKVHHPAAFYAAAMTSEGANTDSVVKFITDARTHGVQVLPPDVSFSENSFSVTEGTIRFGLGAIKGLGEAAVEAILEARETGPFRDLFDFCERVNTRRCNRRTIETLVRCGAFDSTLSEQGSEITSLSGLGRWRARMFEAIGPAMERGAQIQRDKEAGQANLFDLFGGGGSTPQAAPAYPDAPGWTESDTLKGEKEVLGYYVSGHPLDRYRDEVARFADSDALRLLSRDHGAEVVLAGVVADRNERVTKKGDHYAFLQLEDWHGQVEVAVFSKVWEQCHELIAGDEPLLVKGRVRIDGDAGEMSWKVVASEVLRLSEVREASVQEVVLGMDPSWFTPANLQALQRVVAAHSGECKLLFRVSYPGAMATYRLGLESGVCTSEAFVHELKTLVPDVEVHFR